MDDRCRYPGCKQDSEIIYLTKPLCDRHWGMIDTNPKLLRSKIGLPPIEVTTPAMRVPTKARQQASVQPQIASKRSVFVVPGRRVIRQLIQKPVPAAPEVRVGVFDTSKKAERPARWGAQG